MKTQQIDDCLGEADLDQLHTTRAQLLADVAVLRSASARSGDPDHDEETLAAVRALESRILLVDDEIWRREDARLDAEVLATCTTRRVAWSEVDPDWPLARPAWDRELGPDPRDDLSLLVWTGPPRKTPRGQVEDRRLLAVDEPLGCRVEGPLDKTRHPLGCRCRLWSPGEERWVALGRDGLVFQIDPGRQVEGLLLGRGPDATFFVRSPGGSPSTRTTLGTWLIRPTGRLPLRLLASVQLDQVLPGLVGETLRVLRLPDLGESHGPRRQQYSVRVVGATSVVAPGGDLPRRYRALLEDLLPWLRADRAGAVVDGLRCLGLGDGQGPALTRRGTARRLADLADYARAVLGAGAADAVARLHDAVLGLPSDGPPGSTGGST